MTPRGVPVQTWEDCYSKSWVGTLFAGGMAHPAKISRGLLERILDFGLAEGFWDKESILGDCFGGVGTTGILCSYRGIRSVSVELEPRFYGLSMATRRLHRHKLARLGCPLPVYLRGDSRSFAAIAAGALAGVITSPPYANADLGGDGQRKMSGSYSAEKNKALHDGKGFHGTYGKATEGNLGNLPAGTLDGAVTSPPYATGDTAGPESLARRTDEAAARMSAAQRWGTGGQTTDGNLAALPAGTLDGAVTSPPWGDQHPNHTEDASWHQRRDSIGPHNSLGQCQDYGTTPGQVGALPAGTPGGNGEPDTYWRAVAQIYQQVRLALKPGGVFVCVVKSFVKNGAIVDLPGQTAQLLTRLGFTVFLEVHALLTKVWHEPDLFDGAVRKERKRASFFRRLAEKKGSPPIDHETVLFCRSPP